MEHGYILTDEGRQKVSDFIANCQAKRKEIMDAGKDICDETHIPDESEILKDIECEADDGQYESIWGVTDHYEADYPLQLKEGTDFRPITNKEFMCTLDTALFEATMHTLYFEPRLWVKGMNAEKQSTPNIFAVRAWLDEPYNSDTKFWRYILSDGDTLRND